MKFAFSTKCCPQSDPASVAARAKVLGYQGVEIAAEHTGQWTAKEIANETVIACLDCTMARQALNNDAADVVQAAMRQAQTLHCQRVKIAGLPGGDLSKLAGWLGPLGDAAIDRGVTLVIENQSPFADAHSMWLLLERLDHPAIAAAWDACTAAIHGQSPWVSVPTLNHRIAYATVRDAQIHGNTVQPCPIGQGTVPLEAFVTRLMGIGYQGWITVEPPVGEESISPAELADALLKLQNWSKPPVAKRPHRAAPVRH